MRKRISKSDYEGAYWAIHNAIVLLPPEMAATLRLHNALYEIGKKAKI